MASLGLNELISRPVASDRNMIMMMEQIMKWKHQDLLMTYRNIFVNIKLFVMLS